MPRFPLRLSASLALAHFAHKPKLAQGAGPVQFVEAAELLHHDANHPVSHERIREIVSSRSPVVWIGGSEPLHHPGVSHLVRAITQSGHFVFLETDGALLRRRIHEFQPTSRLFLTVGLEPGGQRRASKEPRTSAWELAGEGIRAARLSGFLICLHARVHEETEMRIMAELIQYSRALDVDGMVVSAPGGQSNSANVDARAFEVKTAEARKLIGNWWWESFSRIVEPVVSGERNVVHHGDEAGVQQQSHVNAKGVKVA